MGDSELADLKSQPHVASWRLGIATFLESRKIQGFIVVVILLNSFLMGLETSQVAMANYGRLIIVLDKICLAIFALELALKLFTYQLRFWKSPWNLFDFFVVGIALTPGAGPWSVLRTLRVLRVLRLLTVIPALRRVVAAFLQSIPGLGGVVAVMLVFFYTTGVLATRLFGSAFPEWFGTLPASLYSLFQIMTLESWSMGIVRPIMEVYPYAWAFFVPFIVVATFTILNLFIGIIVSTMQELSVLPEKHDLELTLVLNRLEADLKTLKSLVEAQKQPTRSSKENS